MVLKRYAILVIVLIYGIAIATSKELTDHYGLSFHSHEVNQDERTEWFHRIRYCDDGAR